MTPCGLPAIITADRFIALCSLRRCHHSVVKRFFFGYFMTPNKRSTFKVARDSDKGGIKALQLESLVVGVEGDASTVSGDAARIHRWLVAVKRPVTMLEIHKVFGEWRDGRCGGPGWYAVRGFPTEELIDASLAYEQTDEVAD